MTLVFLFLLFIILLSIIFLVSRSFSKNLYAFFFLITSSKTWALRLTALFLIPGTTLHELSHWFTAELLQVATGKIELWPKADEASGIKMGSVQIAKVDVFRRTIIGIAPLISGITLLTLVLSFT